jgi:hypothetical protein
LQWITWTFGDPKWFGKMLNDVSQKATLDANGNLANGAGRRWEDLAFPAHLVESIGTTREQGLKKILSAMHQRIQKLMRMDSEEALCRSQNSDEQ